MLRSILTFILLIMAFSACKNQVNSEIPGNDDIFEFSVVNQEGKDLLDPDHNASYDTSKIRLYDLIDRKAVLIDDPNKEPSHGYLFFERDGMYRIRPYINGDGSLERRGIIRWNESQQDTIALKLVQQSKHTQRLVQISFNDEIVWDETEKHDDERYFQIVK